MVVVAEWQTAGHAPVERAAGVAAVKQRLVVVGNGMAGARAVEEILARGGERYHITMIGEEPYGNYNRMRLSNVLSGADTAAGIFLNPLEWYAEHDITLHAGVRATGIDRHSRQVRCDDGTSVSYDILLLATGSRPFFPALDGLTLADGTPRPGVFGFRTLDDCRAMLRYAAGRRRAVVLGGGLLGLEAARGLQARGLEVAVVHGSRSLLNQQLDASAGAILRSTIERLGIHVHLDKAAEAVLGQDEVTGLRCADDTVIECDLLVVACGTRPNADLGLHAGLRVERGIVVDDQLRSVDDPRIYAVGECAQHRGRVYGLVAPVWEQAAVLAEHLTGRNQRAAYQGSKIATKLKANGVEMAVMGLSAPERPDDEFVQSVQPQRGVYRSLVIREGKLVGATLLGDINRAAFLLQAFDHGTVLPEERLALLVDDAAPARDSVSQLAGTARVCHCNGVTMASIQACIATGARTLDQVMAGTRAGTGCGSCRGLLREIIAQAADEAPIEAPAP
jgi:nitrite reductase (NADH) large subunit